MTAVELLDQQQRGVERIFAALMSAQEMDQARLNELATELAAHLRVEEEVLFPLAQLDGASEIADLTIASMVLRRCDDPRLGDRLMTVLELAERQRDDAALAIDHGRVEEIGDVLAARLDRALMASASLA